jgi:hypothetical protein
MRCASLRIPCLVSGPNILWRIVSCRWIRCCISAARCVRHRAPSPSSATLRQIRKDIPVTIERKLAGPVNMVIFAASKARSPPGADAQGPNATALQRGKTLQFASEHEAGAAQFHGSSRDAVRGGYRAAATRAMAAERGAAGLGAWCRQITQGLATVSARSHRRTAPEPHGCSRRVVPRRTRVDQVHRGFEPRHQTRPVSAS